MKKPTIFFAGLILALFAVQPLFAQKPATAKEQKKEQKKEEKKEQKEEEKKEQKEAVIKEEKEEKPQTTTPKNMVELGINGGLGLVAGDIDLLPSYGVGIHVRKALDYIFSIRGDFVYSLLRGADARPPFREYETKWRSGTVFGVVTLNALRWNRSVRATNLYFMGGAGMSNYDMEFKQTKDPRRGFLESVYTAHVAAGVGFSVRVGGRINIGLEQQGFLLFGKNADFVDGFDTRIGNTDNVSFSNVSINFNLGNKSNTSEPLYWINPLETVLSDIDELKNRPEVKLDDSDQDGVLDVLDMEPETPPGAVVDTKGRTLDSDRDGVPDYLDREPFYTPTEGEQVNDEGVVINPGAGRPQGVTEDRVRELIDEALQTNGVINDNRNTPTEWFLPMIHFNSDQAIIKFTDYGTLASIARMVRANPNLRLVVTGYADGTGAELYNNRLSYNRSKAVIDHLVGTHNIGRGRLVLQWKGSNEVLVPTKDSYMNRRVEFRIAGAGDVEMDPPGTKGGY